MVLKRSEVVAWANACKDLWLRNDCKLVVQRTSLIEDDGKITIVTYVIDRYGAQSLTVEIDGHVRYVWIGERDEEPALN